MLRSELLRILNTLLSVDSITDFCPNGLQVEGAEHVSKIVTGVTASEALIDAAIKEQADTIIVHHGYFWKGESQCVTGMKKKRIAKLLAHNINLIAYHLPLDVHAELGNNAQLGQLFACSNIQPVSSISPLGIVMKGELPSPCTHQELSILLQNVLAPNHVVSVGDKKDIKTIAWCTGGGQGYIDSVVQASSNEAIDAFISGEISEQTTHSAIEQGMDYFAAGHHATERYGVKALGQWLENQHSLDLTFVDIFNPA